MASNFVTLSKPFSSANLNSNNSSISIQRLLGARRNSTSLRINAIAKKWEPTKVIPQADRVLIRLEELPEPPSRTFYLTTCLTFLKEVSYIVVGTNIDQSCEGGFWRPRPLYKSYPCPCHWPHRLLTSGNRFMQDYTQMLFHLSDPFFIQRPFFPSSFVYIIILTLLNSVLVIVTSENNDTSAGGVLLPKSAVKFERYLTGEVLSVGADVGNVEAGKKVLFSDISAYEVDLGTEARHCFCKESDLLAVAGLWRNLFLAGQVLKCRTNSGKQTILGISTKVNLALAFRLADDTITNSITLEHVLLWSRCQSLFDFEVVSGNVLQKCIIMHEYCPNFHYPCFIADSEFSFSKHVIRKPGIQTKQF
ncbi:GroES chaperonin family [Dillenia turbinata]|uniref:GroES chaperonin family n=1 Tax=Dillenia turbinata TaxID=194707 RepID=A0AAN8YZ14_9MAGN